MRNLAIMLLVLIVAGIAPVMVASGFCADGPCCPQSDGDPMIATSCCGDVVCSERDSGELTAPELLAAAALAPLAEEFVYVAPAARPLTERAPLLQATASDRLSLLSILLI